MFTCNMCSIDCNCVFNNPYKNNIDMKANAPEKLYLSKTIYSTYLYQVPDPDDETAVEYTRTDAFIEKACEFLKSYRQETYDGKGYIAGIVNDETIEDFRKYMKGE